MTGGIRLFRIFGIEVYLDWSLLVIFTLITVSLGLGVFPAWHPDWPAAYSLAVGVVAAVLFLASILIHELSHSVVGRARGMVIRRITLFIFGGMAHLESEPPDWKSEFWMAIAGPIASVVLGILFITLGTVIAGPEAIDPDDPVGTMEQLGALATIFFWLGPINILLAIFNMVPGFPLDGGRVLRSLLWGASGNMTSATRWASFGGRAFAWLLIMAGIAMILGIHVPPFGAGLIPGLWLCLIGWFLHNAAMNSFRDVQVRGLLEDVKVAQLMQRDLLNVPDTLDLQTLVDHHVLAAGDQRAWPVEHNGRLVGLITLNDVRRVPRTAWSHTRVGEAMTPLASLVTTAPGESAAKALEKLAGTGVNQLPVMETDALVGLLRREELIRWVSWSGR